MNNVGTSNTRIFEARDSLKYSNTLTDIEVNMNMERPIYK